MDFREIILRQQDGVSTIILNRPDLMNVLTFDMLRELQQALKCCAADEDTKVIVLTGTGRVFSAGGDIQTMVSGMNTKETVSFIDASAEMIRLITSIDKPIIASVNGLAAGACFDYILAADLAIASENARFTQGFSKLGMLPDAGGTYFLPRILGLKKAKEIIYTNPVIGAVEAENMGIVNRVVKHEDLEQETMKLAEQLANGPSQAISLCKLILNRSLDTDLDNALATETYAQVVLMQTEDHKEGIKAFLEKRNPLFSK
jgi:2-(1,2-epoxy-1,2-dihydrophenyl)acetyl-CoA isomerase